MTPNSSVSATVQPTGQQHIRLSAKVPEAKLRSLVGTVPADDTYDILLAPHTCPDGAKVTVPEMEEVYVGGGKTRKQRRTLCIYLPGAVKEQMDQTYPILTTIRNATDNRGHASGNPSIKVGKRQRIRQVPVLSSIIGYMDPKGPMQYCRLTAWTAKQLDQWHDLEPLWRAMSDQFEANIAHRYQAQVREARKTPPDWIIPGTPFTTITVNNSYPTGVHKDKGDLGEGFSCLAVTRRGDWTGGRLVFPQWRVAIDMQDGDMVLMDAHAEWHGNTAIICKCGNRLNKGPCEACGAERVSVVAYYRTGMYKCQPKHVEDARKEAWERHYGRTLTKEERAAQEKEFEDAVAANT